MIDRYLERGIMYLLEDEGIKAECVLTEEADGILEIKNIAVDPLFRGKGYGRALLTFVEKRYQSRFSVLQAGTGESPPYPAVLSKMWLCILPQNQKLFPRSL